MNNGDLYVVDSENSLYSVPASSCSEGSSLDLYGLPVIQVNNVNGKWVKARTFSYSAHDEFICNVWSDSLSLNPNFLVLPAVLLVLAFFSCIYHWFLRFRG